MPAAAFNEHLMGRVMGLLLGLDYIATRNAL